MITDEQVRAALLAFHSGDMDWDSQDEELMRLALEAAALSTVPSAGADADIPATRGGHEPNWWEEWVKTTRAYNRLAKAAQAVIDETSAIHDNEPWPIRYRAPYDAITKLTDSLVASDRLVAVSPPASEAQVRVKAALEKAMDALRPMADAVLNDNGDMTVDIPLPTAEECIQAYFATKHIAATLSTPEQGETEAPQTHLMGIAPTARIVFGLEAQGHIPTVEAALAEGADWQEIGRRIGWDGDTAKAYYERHLAGRTKPGLPTILHCAVCGADESSTYLGAPGPGIVRCFAVGCDAQVGGFSTDEEAIAEWNRRAVAMDAAMTEAYCTSDDDLIDCFRHHVTTTIGWLAFGARPGPEMQMYEEGFKAGYRRCQSDNEPELGEDEDALSTRARKLVGKLRESINAGAVQLADVEDAIDLIIDQSTTWPQTTPTPPSPSPSTPSQRKDETE